MVVKSFRSIDMIATGRKITELRVSKGYSVKDLQEYFGFDAPQAIYKWQRGQSLPSTDNLYALSFLFEVPMEEILVPLEFQAIYQEPQDKTCGSHVFGKKIFRSHFPVFHKYLYRKAVCHFLFSCVPDPSIFSYPVIAEG